MVAAVFAFFFSAKFETESFRSQVFGTEEMRESLQKVNRLCAYNSILFIRLNTNDFCFMLSYRIAINTFYHKTKQHSVYFDTSRENT